MTTPEIRNFDTLEFSEEEKTFVLGAVSSYISQLSSGNENPIDKIRAMSQTLDDINEERIIKAKQKPSCKKGCAHCCYIQVNITEWEADSIMDFLKESKAEFTEEEKERLKHQSEIKNDSEYILSPHRRCIFLMDNNECGIYPVRPLACRNYYVYNDPEDCNTFNDKASGRTLVDFDLNTLPPILAIMQLSQLNSLPRLLYPKFLTNTNF